VDKVLVVSVCKLLWFGVVDLGEDDGGERGGLGRGGCSVFGQYNCTMSNAGVEERCRWGG